MELAGKTILITGGGSGIGLEAGKQFLENGANVIITGRNQDKLDQAKQLYPALITFRSDAGNPQEANALYKQVEAMGGIDLLYNNAGVMGAALNLGITNDKHSASARYEMDVNYFGVIYLNNLFLDMLKARPEGAIINTTSLLSYVPSITETTYSASKAALRFYTETLRTHLQLSGSQVKVFELLPPVVDTPMTADRKDKKITPEFLINKLIAGIKNDTFTIRVGDTKIVYWVNRLFPALAYKLVNPEDSFGQIK